MTTVIDKKWGLRIKGTDDLVKNSPSQESRPALFNTRQAARQRKTHNVAVVPVYTTLEY